MTFPSSEPVGDIAALRDQVKQLRIELEREQAERSRVEGVIRELESAKLAVAVSRRISAPYAGLTEGHFRAQSKAEDAARQRFYRAEDAYRDLVFELGVELPGMEGT